MKVLKNLILTLFVLFIVSSCSSTPGDDPESRAKKADILYGQGTSDLINQEYTSALKNLIEADQFKPDDPKILNNLGMAYYFKNKTDLATSYIKKSIELNNNSDARNNLASIYYSQKKYSLAEKEYQAILNDLTYLHQYRTYYALALIQLVGNNFLKAKKYLIQATLENDEYCPAHFKLGELYFEEKKFEKALGSFQKASQGTCINNPAPRYYQGLSLIKLNKLVHAKRVFEEIEEKFSGKERYSRLSKEKRKMIDKGLISTQNNETLNISNKDDLKESIF